MRHEEIAGQHRTFSLARRARFPSADPSFLVSQSTNALSPRNRGIGFQPVGSGNDRLEAYPTEDRASQDLAGTPHERVAGVPAAGTRGKLGTHDEAYPRLRESDREVAHRDAGDEPAIRDGRNLPCLVVVFLLGVSPSVSPFA